MMNIWQGLSYFWSYFTPFSFVTAYFGVDAVFKTRQGTQKVMPVNVSTIDMGTNTDTELVDCIGDVNS